MFRPLHNEYEAMNEEGRQIVEEAEKLLEPLFDRERLAGTHSLREVAGLIHAAVNGLEAVNVLKTAIEKHNTEKHNTSAEAAT